MPDIYLSSPKSQPEDYSLPSACVVHYRDGQYILFVYNPDTTAADFPPVQWDDVMFYLGATFYVKFVKYVGKNHFMVDDMNLMVCDHDLRAARG